MAQTCGCSNQYRRLSIAFVRGKCMVAHSALSITRHKTCISPYLYMTLSPWFLFISHQLQKLFYTPYLFICDHTNQYIINTAKFICAHDSIERFSRYDNKSGKIWSFETRSINMIDVKILNQDIGWLIRTMIKICIWIAEIILKYEMDY